MSAPRIVHAGLGPVGITIGREILRRSAGRLVGAVDIDPAKVGHDLGTVLGLDDELGLAIADDLAATLDAGSPDLLLLTTTSSLEALSPAVLEAVGRGVSVLTTCEELSYPWTAQPGLAGRLDQAARAGGAAILSTGVNPGFVMDYLPAASSSLCRNVQSVRVERVLDAGRRRQAFQDKVGAGLDLAAFRAKAESGTLRHVGLRESVDMIAAALGWQLDDYNESLDVVLAEAGDGSGIEPGRARGVRQEARGTIGGETRITLDFRAAVGAGQPRDRLVLDAEPPIDLTIAGGVHGDVATCNIVVNSIAAVLGARPGLRTMLDIGPPGCRVAG